MYQNCEKAIKLTIPALRIAVSRSLSSEHGMSETEIAKILGVAQASVSKYLTGRYSAETKGLVKEIMADNLQHRIVKAITGGAGATETAKIIDSVASDSRLVDAALGRIRARA
ncbi:MAG: hypothetical protein KGI06_00580 [Candidatus Micrarchaeota archaeon]|nr:hypothetical protein [Candidatus Micrarchaeota archaeon]